MPKQTDRRGPSQDVFGIRSALKSAPGAESLKADAWDAIDRLEHLPDDPSLTGKRFGSMLRELRSPELLAFALLFRKTRRGPQIDATLQLARTLFGALHWSPDGWHIVEFLIRDDLRMSQLALRPDADDTRAVEDFAAYLNAAALFNTFTTEEHLKMLSLMTLVTLDADAALTPLKSELLWRLFVDTYNYLIKAYGDQVIDAGTITRTALNADRPPDIPEPELVQFLAGLPKRYLTLFRARSIYEHVRLSRNIGPDDVHFFLEREDGVSELTIATLDKPFLFSNACGVLSYLGMDILDGQALTSTRGLVLDLFRFRDPQGTLDESELKSLLSNVIAGRTQIAALLRARHKTADRAAASVPPVIAFDNEASHQYTIIEIVAQDSPGLLYRVSLALSTFGCEIDMVVISTEETKAIDVFHVRKDGAKLMDSDELPLTEALEQAITHSFA